MLKRRKFMATGMLLGLSTCIQAKKQTVLMHSFQKVKSVIAAVQAHMFPVQSQLPSANEANVIAFLYETIMHTSYDKDIRLFVIEGAETLIAREQKSFLDMSEEQREQSLRRYEKTNYGSAWLARIMTLTMEGLFSDPIYGANKDEIAWKSIDMYGGLPRPRVKYLEH